MRHRLLARIFFFGNSQRDGANEAPSDKRVYLSARGGICRPVMERLVAAAYQHVAAFHRLSLLAHGPAGIRLVSQDISVLRRREVGSAVMRGCRYDPLVRHHDRCVSLIVDPDVRNVGTSRHYERLSRAAVDGSLQRTAPYTASVRRRLDPLPVLVPVADEPYVPYDHIREHESRREYERADIKPRAFKAFQKIRDEAFFIYRLRAKRKPGLRQMPSPDTEIRRAVLFMHIVKRDASSLQKRDRRVFVSFTLTHDRVTRKIVNQPGHPSAPLCTSPSLSCP